MKKVLLVLVMIAFTFGMNAQEIIVNKDVEYEFLYGSLTLVDYRQNEDRKGFDFAIHYRNSEYKHIIDLGWITFDNIDEIEKMVDLMLEMLESKEYESSVTTDKYRLHRYKFAKKYIYIYDKDSKRNAWNKKQILRLKEVVTDIKNS